MIKEMGDETRLRLDDDCWSLVISDMACRMFSDNKKLTGSLGIEGLF